MILVVNAGSSSVKFQLYEARDAVNLMRAVKGQIDGVGSRPRLHADAADVTTIVDQVFSIEQVPDVFAAIQTVGIWLREAQKIELFAVGHRVAHGGPDHSCPVLVDNVVLKKLERYVPLAPLHQPNNLAPIQQSAQSRSCLRSPVSTQRFIGVMVPLWIISRFLRRSMLKVCAATDFMDCPTNT